MGLKSFINNQILAPRGYKVIKNIDYNDPKVSAPDITDPEFLKIYHLAKPYTATSIHRMYALFMAVKYVIQNGIEGDFVECGVWKGGSTMVIAATLKLLEVTDRKLYLYDTFEGMSTPTADDVDLKGRDADYLLYGGVQELVDENICFSPIEEVKANMALTGYPDKHTYYVKGMVEDTIPGVIQEKIALLRLDTDFYESTKHEMLHLYPLLVKRGILLIDDYGHWQGARKAIDEYFEANNIHSYLSRIDYTGRIMIKE